MTSRVEIERDKLTRHWHFFCVLHRLDADWSIDRTNGKRRAATSFSSLFDVRSLFSFRSRTLGKYSSFEFEWKRRIVIAKSAVVSKRQFGKSKRDDESYRDVSLQSSTVVAERTRRSLSNVRRSSTLQQRNHFSQQFGFYLRPCFPSRDGTGRSLPRVRGRVDRRVFPRVQRLDSRLRTDRFGQNLHDGQRHRVHGPGEGRRPASGDFAHFPTL